MPNASKRFILPQTYYIEGTRSRPIPFGVLNRELTAVLVYDISTIESCNVMIRLPRFNLWCT
jgi:hypothetical protein